MGCNPEGAPPSKCERLWRVHDESLVWVEQVTVVSVMYPAGVDPDPRTAPTAHPLQGDSLPPLSDQPRCPEVKQS